MKTIDDALELRRRIFGAFEMAEVATIPPSGSSGSRSSSSVPGRPGSSWPGRSASWRCAASRASSARSIRRRCGCSCSTAARSRSPRSATGSPARRPRSWSASASSCGWAPGWRGVDAFGVDVAGADGGKSRIDAHTTIWAAGVQASPLAAKLAEASGAEVDRAGRIAVLPDLTLPGHPEVFAIGDMAALDNLPGVAEVAMQGGLHAANTIRRRLNGKDPVPFKYRDLGSVATIGRFRAIASVHKVRLSGFPGWVVWFFVHLAFLTGFGDRFTTMMRWLRSMIGRGRAEREFSTAHTGGDLSLPESVRRSSNRHRSRTPAVADTANP